MTAFSDEHGDGVLARAAALLDAFDDEHREPIPRRCARRVRAARVHGRGDEQAPLPGRQDHPFSLHNVDEMLDDLGLNIPARVRASHWLNPVDPTAYRNVTPTLVRQLAPTVSGPPLTSRSTAPTKG
jgi:hypothetical protein